MDTTTQLMQVASVATDLVARFGLRILGAVALWIVGRRVIGVATRMLARGLDRQQLDPTIVRYAGSSLGVVLTASLAIAILGLFGIETTTFAALFAAGGVAIGVAWSGLLSNFAAGVFLIVLRPFKVGDVVQAGGATGTVEELGLFGTSILTPQNVTTVVGNAKILGDNIENYSKHPTRRVDLTAQVAHGVDLAHARRLLLEGLGGIPNVVREPAPTVEILEFNLAGTVLAVRPFCRSEAYGQVYFDTNRLIAESFDRAGFPPPAELRILRHDGAGAGPDAARGRAAAMSAAD